jgi:hypothetical protein
MRRRRKSDRKECATMNKTKRVALSKRRRRAVKVAEKRKKTSK